MSNDAWLNYKLGRIIVIEYPKYIDVIQILAVVSVLFTISLIVSWKIYFKLRDAKKHERQYPIDRHISKDDIVVNFLLVVSLLWISCVAVCAIHYKHFIPTEITRIQSGIDKRSLE
ncbi:hypothetical protein SBF1_9680003 [Candidatus Desulfosporosinus infrequens]|uniref:Uncharacterized protein n=1 Tax=Candidatus Desulfosporosinus infrequens TaxID=2043169 RepID=A0A2U3LYG8_9FIRM|nr:hypothetical protein SBF1_9680003 [Candidatus Desulfosporosinus infrequens]